MGVQSFSTVNPLALALMGQNNDTGGTPLADKIRMMQLEQTMQGVGDTSPVQHWTQGAARMSNALVSGLMANKMIGDSKAEDAAFGKALMSNPLLGGMSSGPDTTGGKSLAGGDIGNFANAISGIESGGKYDTLGPVTKTGDRAYGKYQVMGANIGPWSQAALGQPMTPQQFLADPKAQDAVFQHRFGQYADKYGPEGAARAWFAGEGGMNNPNARDQLGTTVSSYAQQFNRNAGLPQMASLGGGVPAAPMPQAPQGQQVAQANPAQQPQVAPTSGQQADRMQPAIPDNMKQYINGLLTSGNQKMRAYGMQLLQGYAKPITPEYQKLNDDTLYEKNSGTTKKATSGYRALVTPEERQAYGIQKDDLRPYQVGPANKLINPPPENHINIDQRAETAFDQAAAKHMAERYNDIVKAGFEAKASRADLNALRDLGSKINTGKTTEVIAALGPYAETLGAKIDGLGEMQAYNAIVSKMAPRMRVAGSGATSDFEMRAFLNALPSIGKTPEGNAIVEQTMQALQDHQERAAEIASRAMTKEITTKEADKLLRELPDPLTAWKAANKQELGGSINYLVQKYGK